MFDVRPLSHILILTLGSLVLVSDGCAERQSATPSADSSVPVDTATPPGAEKRERTWAAARGRGVRFRAIGQEPGWIAEVTGDSIEVKWDYGQQTASGSRTDSAASAPSDPLRYRADTDQGPVQVEAVERRCVDPMSGDRFRWTVTVRLKTDTLSGCGRRLRGD